MVPDLSNQATSRFLTHAGKIQDMSPGISGSEFINSWDSEAKEGAAGVRMRGSPGGADAACWSSGCKSHQDP